MSLTKQDQWLYFFELALIIVFHRFIGYLCKKFLKVPRVIGDIIGGCLLGPTIMGQEANSILFPTATRDIIMMCGQMGIIFASMSAGAGFDFRVMRGNAFGIILFTILNHGIPICFAAIVYQILPATDAWQGPKFNSASYFVFLSCIFASSALPMVFLILDELRLFNDLSKFCIGWSCLCTMTLFTILSVAVLLSNPNASGLIIARNFGILISIVIGLIILQKVWTWIDKRWEMKVIGNDRCLNVVVLVLMIAGSTFSIDYTFLLGAFLAGMFVPFNADLRKDVVERVRWITRWILLPQFFVYVGLFLDLRVVKLVDWGYLVLGVFLAFLAKALLTIPVKLLLRYSWLDSFFVAALANCRGFNGLIIASAGQTAGVIGPTFYVFCVAVSLLSSAAAGPVCRLLKPPEPPKPLQPIKEVDTTSVSLDPTDPTKQDTITSTNPELVGTVPPQQEQKVDSKIIEANNQLVDVELPVSDSDFSQDDSRRSSSQEGPEGADPVIQSILRDEAKREMAYLWMEDVVNLLHDPTRGLVASFSHVSSVERKEDPSSRIYSGKEIVDWIMRHYHLPLRTFAEGVGFDLLHRGYFQALTHEKKRSSSLANLFGVHQRTFDDSKKLYRLCEVTRELIRPKNPPARSTGNSPVKKPQSTGNLY